MTSAGPVVPDPDLRAGLHARLTDEAAILDRYVREVPMPGMEPSYRHHELIVVMATRYDLETAEGRMRFGLAQQTMHLLDRLTGDGMRLDMIVADSSPDHYRVSEIFAAYGAQVLDARAPGGIGPQIQLAIAYAYMRGAPYVLKIDPEKYGLAVRNILQPIAHEMWRGKHDILGIGRSPSVPGAGFDSLPQYQRQTERLMSRQFMRLGLPEDGASGIWALGRAGMLVWLAFDTAPPNHMWQILWYAQLQAIAAGFRVGGILLPFIHPIEMVLFETGAFERDPDAGERVAAFWRDKRDSQAALTGDVYEFAASLGIQPRHFVDCRYVI